MNQDQSKTGKRRVLVLADTPTCATGFAMVVRNVLEQLYKTGKYEFDVIGINQFDSWYDQLKFPYRIFRAAVEGKSQDVFGRPRLNLALSGNDPDLLPPWDIIFTINDHYIFEQPFMQIGGQTVNTAELIKSYQLAYQNGATPDYWFKWIAYWPVDSDLKENWVTRSILLADYPVMYTEYGKNMVEYWNLKGDLDLTNLRQIPHGINTDEFYPISEDEKKEFRKSYFNGMVKDDDFLVVNISRNQPRKAMDRSLQIFKEFQKRRPQSKLYMHCKVQDAWGSLAEACRSWGLEVNTDVFFPESFSEHQGVPVDVLNKIYNVADAAMTTTLGEGWGFILTEAMATKTIVLAPNNTSIPEILNTPKGFNENEARGIPIKSFSTSSEWFCTGAMDKERIRPLPNTDDFVEKLVWAYDNPDKVQSIVERAYDWVQTITWSKVVKHWEGLFDEAIKQLDTEREAGKYKTVGRNDSCPCGSGKKYKRCHGTK